jgi:hypothetical protein
MICITRILIVTIWSICAFVGLSVSHVEIAHDRYVARAASELWAETTCNKYGSIMHVEILHVPPSSSSFTPLSTHQSQTPSSFFSSTPVLHFSNRKATLLSTIPSSATGAEPTLPPLFRGTADGADEQVLVEDVDVWVTST